MKRFLFFGMLSTAAFLGLTSDSYADCAGCDGPSAAAPYAFGPGAAAACAPAEEYVEQRVTRYRQVMVDQDVEQVVRRPVSREEKFTYDVTVPVTVPEKRSQTVYRNVSKEVEYSYTVTVPVTVPETRTQTFYRTVNKEVAYNYTVSVPVTVPETRTQTFYANVQREVEYTYTVNVPRTIQRTVPQTTYQCITEQVTENVCVCRTVSVPYTDACGNCCNRCERVMVNEPVTRCVTRRIPVTTEVVINQTVYEPQTQVGKRMVCEVVPQTREVTVNVTRYEMQTRTATRTVSEIVPETQNVTVNVTKYEQQTRVGKRVVCEVVPETSEITVNVTRYETQKREGSRTVTDWVDERVHRTVQVCVSQPYEEVIRVRVNHDYSCASSGGCAPSYEAACVSSCGSGHCRLFRRGCR